MNVRPNVSFVNETNLVYYNPIIIPPASLCDIAYFDGTCVKTISFAEYNQSLGEPVGVVVIPENMLPDGKARIISLSYVDSSGISSSTPIGMQFCSVYYDTELTNFTVCPTTDNGVIAISTFGNLPSDIFSDEVSIDDPKAYYKANTKNKIPSPYVGDDKTLNTTSYFTELDGNNVFTDINGLTNTETLINNGTDYIAANAAWNYNDGKSNLQWYLPSIGELGVLMARYNEINNRILDIGGNTLIGPNTNTIFWSSTEHSNEKAHIISIASNSVTLMGGSNKQNSTHRYVRPFAILDKNK